MAWRRLVIDGVEYRYQVGTGAAVIQLPNGKKRIVPLSKIKRFEHPDLVGRGRWKQTSDGMIRPHEVRRYIEEDMDADG